MLVPSNPILVIRGFAVSRENSAVHMRDASSGQRTVKVSLLTETVTGPCLTPETSAGTTAAKLSTGIRRMESLILRPDGYFGGAFQHACDVFDADAWSLRNGQRALVDLQLRLEPVGIFFDAFFVFLIRADITNDRSEMKTVDEAEAAGQVDG